MNSSARARVMVALLYEEAHGRRPTIPSLVKATGLARCTVHKHLCALRRDGLVSWTQRQRGTLHSTVAVVVPRV